MSLFGIWPSAPPASGQSFDRTMSAAEMFRHWKRIEISQRERYTVWGR